MLLEMETCGDMQLPLSLPDSGRGNDLMLERSVPFFVFGAQNSNKTLLRGDL
jgi:hypothetical protein